MEKRPFLALSLLRLGGIPAARGNSQRSRWCLYVQFNFRQAVMMHVVDASVKHYHPALAALSQSAHDST